MMDSATTLVEYGQRPTKLGGPASYGSYAVQKRIGALDRAVVLSGMRVLDLGCGNGCYTEEIASRADWVCGMDIQISNLRQFQRSLPRVQSVGEKLPFDANAFDAITMIEVLEHTDCDHGVLAECYRVLRAGGLLILFVPNKLYPLESHPCYLGKRLIGRNIPFVSWLPKRIHDRLCPARIYTSRGLTSLAAATGFQLQHVGYIFPPIDSLPLPLPLKRMYREASWWVEKTPLRVFGVSIFAVFQKPLS